MVRRGRAWKVARWLGTRRRKWILAASAAAVVVLATATALGRRMAAERLLEEVRVAVHDACGLGVRADGVTLSLLRGTAVIEGFRVEDGPVTVLEAATIEVEGRLLDVLGGRYECARLTVLRPVVRIAVEADGRTNLGRILARGTGSPPRPGPGDLLLLRGGTFEEGRIEFTDAVTDPDRPVRIVVHRLRGKVSEWQFDGMPATGSSADLRADGEIEQPGFPARVCVVAWRAPPGGIPAWTLLAEVTGFDVRPVPAYVGAAERAALGGDHVHVAVDIRARNGAIGPGTVVGEVAGSGVVLPMGVGGTTREPVFDAGSPLATLLRVPLARVGRIGEISFDAGWSVVRGGAGAAAEVGGGVVDAGAALGTGLGNAGGELLEGNPLGAVEEAGGGVLGVFTSLGGGLLDGAGSLLGGGAEAVRSLEGEDAAALDRRFGERHAVRRRSMLRAALASAGGAGAAARHDRIAADIEVSLATPGHGPAR